MDVSFTSSGGGAAVAWKTETLTGIVNGVNPTFTISQAATDANSYFLFVDTFQVPATDYTLVGTTITFVTPPAFGKIPYIKFT
jgi:hypothetical protein